MFSFTNTVKIVSLFILQPCSVGARQARVVREGVARKTSTTPRKRDADHNENRWWYKPLRISKWKAILTYFGVIQECFSSLASRWLLLSQTAPQPSRLRRKFCSKSVTTMIIMMLMLIKWWNGINGIRKLIIYVGCNNQKIKKTKVHGSKWRYNYIRQN